MNSKHRTHNSTQNFVVLFLAVFLTCVFFSAHLTASKIIAFGAIYCMVILYSWLLPWKNSSVYAGIICSALTIIAVFLNDNQTETNHYAGINTIISLITIWITVSLVAIARRGFQELESITNQLEEKVNQKTLELAESEQLYKFLYENANEMYVSVNPTNGSIIKCNNTFSKKIGYTKEELIGAPILSIYDNSSKEKVKEILETFKVKGIIKNKELTLSTKNNNKIKVLLNATAVKDENGNILYSRSSLFDITEIKNLEHKFSSLLESAPDAMLIVNEEGKIKLSNKQSENIFGFTKEELIGSKTEQLVHSRYKKNIINFFSDPNLNNKPLEQELMGRKKNGKEFPIEISLNPIQTFEGPLTIIAIRDITKRREIEREQQRYNKLLEQKNKELEQFVYIASHDLQQPIQTVSDFTKLLLEKFSHQNDDETNTYLNFILGANQRMKNLVTGLLNYGLIGKKEEQLKVDCNEIIDQVIADLGSSLKDTNAVFNYQNLPVIKCYPTEFRLLFQNLISNAIKFRKPDTSPIIKITAFKKKKYWEFSVKDNGIGISDKYKEKVFDIFQRLHSKKEYEGVGIGLAHCRKIVELHGGDIWLESEEGKGSTFYFTIPFKI